MIGYFEENQHAFWFAVGFVLLAIEIGFLGLASGIVLFAGIGALVTGIMLWLGWLPNTWLEGIAQLRDQRFRECRSPLETPAQAVELQNPRQRQQQRPDRLRIPPATADHHYKPRQHQAFGVEWRVEIDESCELPSMEAGHKVVVASVDAGVFRVKPAEQNNE
jgi:membrane protein implicated in regulation of membrane protease activity